MGSNAVWLHLEKRHRRDARPQPDLVSSCSFHSSYELFCEPREEKSREWLFDGMHSCWAVGWVNAAACGLKCRASLPEGCCDAFSGRKYLMGVECSGGWHQGLNSTPGLTVSPGSNLCAPFLFLKRLDIT